MWEWDWVLLLSVRGRVKPETISVPTPAVPVQTQIVVQSLELWLGLQGPKEHSRSEWHPSVLAVIIRGWGGLLKGTPREEQVGEGPIWAPCPSPHAQFVRGHVPVSRGLCNFLHIVDALGFL